MQRLKRIEAKIEGVMERDLTLVRVGVKVGVRNGVLGWVTVRVTVRVRVSGSRGIFWGYFVPECY